MKRIFCENAAEAARRRARGNTPRSFYFELFPGPGLTRQGGLDVGLIEHSYVSLCNSGLDGLWCPGRVWDFPDSIRDDASPAPGCTRQGAG